MPMSGELPRNLGALASNRSEQGVIPFCFEVITVAGTSSYLVTEARFKFKVISFYTFCMGAGGAGDTVQLDKTSTSTHISDALDVNDADNTLSMCTTIDDAYSTVLPGEKLIVTTASGAVVRAYILCIPVE